MRTIPIGMLYVSLYPYVRLILKCLNKNQVQCNLPFFFLMYLLKKICKCDTKLKSISVRKNWYLLPKTSLSVQKQEIIELKFYLIYKISKYKYFK